MNRTEIKQLHPNLTGDQIDEIHEKLQENCVTEELILKYLFLPLYIASLSIVEISDDMEIKNIGSFIVLELTLPMILLLGNDQCWTHPSRGNINMLLAYVFGTVSETLCLFILKKYESNLLLKYFHFIALAINILYVLRLSYILHQHRVIKKLVETIKNEDKKPTSADL